MADLVIACHEWDVTLSLKLAADLAMQRLLVAFYRQQEVGSLLLELVKNGFWVWSASAWISTPSRSKLTKQLLLLRRSLGQEYAPLMVLTCGEAGLGDPQTESRGAERHLVNEYRATAGGGHARAPQGLAITH